MSSSQRPLPDNTRHSQQTNIHAPGGIRTQVLSRRAAADLRLRPRGHWDRQTLAIRPSNSYCGEPSSTTGYSARDCVSKTALRQSLVPQFRSSRADYHQTSAPSLEASPNIIRLRFQLATTLTLRLLMSYIYMYGAPILDVSRSHTTTQHSR